MAQMNVGPSVRVELSDTRRDPANIKVNELEVDLAQLRTAVSVLSQMITDKERELAKRLFTRWHLLSNPQPPFLIKEVQTHTWWQASRRLATVTIVFHSKITVPEERIQGTLSDSSSPMFHPNGNSS